MPWKGLHPHPKGEAPLLLVCPRRHGRPRAHQKQLSSCRLPLLQVGAGVRPHQEQNRAVRVAADARENNQYID